MDINDKKPEFVQRTQILAIIDKYINASQTVIKIKAAKINDSPNALQKVVNIFSAIPSASETLILKKLRKEIENL